MGMGATSHLQLLSPGDLGTSSLIPSASLPGTLSLMMIFVYGLLIYFETDSYLSQTGLELPLYYWAWP